MNSNELRREVYIEFDAIQSSIDELESLLHDVGDRQAAVRELAAAGLFLANFYGGIENVLKRICRFHRVEIPQGDSWHVELVRSFRDPSRQDLPPLLDLRLSDDLAPYRQFRHVIHHGYGFRLRWEDMLPGIEGARSVFERFQAAVQDYLDEMENNPG